MSNQRKSYQIAGWFLRGRNRSTRRKTSRSRVQNQQTQTTCDAKFGSQTRATLMGVKCFQHSVIPAPKQECLHLFRFVFFLVLESLLGLCDAVCLVSAFQWNQDCVCQNHMSPDLPTWKGILSIFLLKHVFEIRIYYTYFLTFFILLDPDQFDAI